MVSSGRHAFWCNSNGKYDLRDVFEFASAFLAIIEGHRRSAQAFRIDRINRLVAGESSVKWTGSHLLVLHLLPVVSAHSKLRLTTTDLQKFQNDHRLRPIGDHGGWGGGFNFDGVLVASSAGGGSCYASTQLFRSGYIEAVTARCAFGPAQSWEERRNGDGTSPSIAWEQRLLEVFSGYLEVLGTLGFTAPYVAGLALLSVRGYVMAVDPN